MLKALIVTAGILFSLNSYAGVSVNIDGEVYTCSQGGEGDFACVPNCANRLSNGNCSRFTEDYCGVNVSCTPNCANRLSNGQCSRYAEDFCGVNATCTPKCANRLSNGQCSRYAEDRCTRSST